MTTTLHHWINGKRVPAASGQTFEKQSPATGEVIAQVARGNKADVDAAVAAAKAAQAGWGKTPPVQRGLILHEVVKAMQANAERLGAVVGQEVGKGINEAMGEVGGAAQCGLFFASEGQRLFGKTTTSGTPNKSNMTVRQPIGVAGLIIAANTPIANVAWKVFPALICGNAVVLKAAEDTPETADVFAELAHAAGLPAGVLNVVQGIGAEAGPALVQHEDVRVISFTGSTRVGKEILLEGSKRMARVSLELGGKNALVVCDDADLEVACKWVLLSAFSNAGQRCASGSRIIVFDEVYDRFKAMLLEATAKLNVGATDDDDLGPVINERQLGHMLTALEKAKSEGAAVLIGGDRFRDDARLPGCYMQPTLVEGSAPGSELSCTELFGPIASLYRVAGFDEALAMTNDSPYGLTACIHTTSLHRAWRFAQEVDTGVCVVNAGTFGSEPHMPFGGTKWSGNGTREPGTEALDVYSELKDIYLNIDPTKV